MLFLSRKPHQAILLRTRDGQPIARITLQEIRSDAKVRLGFEAGDDVIIIREELIERDREWRNDA